MKQYQIAFGNQKIFNL